MKQIDLKRLFKDKGWYYLRDGGSHEIWTNGKETEEIPRHREINERLAKYLIKKHKLK